MATGQAGGALHTMAALQAYQAGLLKDLDEDKGLSPEAVEELHHRLNRLLQNGGYVEAFVVKSCRHQEEAESFSS